MWDEDKAWFAPKRYGYGAGLPIAWQGWLVAAAYSLTVVGCAYFIAPLSPVAFAAIVLMATAALLIVCAQKTRGGWHWRWGGKD